jgi:hypothetical protein
MPDLWQPVPVSVVHLRRAEIDDEAVRAGWHARGYATVGPVEGHDPHLWCPHCSVELGGPDAG